MHSLTWTLSPYLTQGGGADVKKMEIHLVQQVGK